MCLLAEIDSVFFSVFDCFVLTIYQELCVIFLKWFRPLHIPVNLILYILRENIEEKRYKNLILFEHDDGVNNSNDQHLSSIKYCEFL